MAISRVITTRAIRFPSRWLRSMWRRIGALLSADASKRILLCGRGANSATVIRKAQQRRLGALQRQMSTWSSGEIPTRLRQDQSCRTLLSLISPLITAWVTGSSIRGGGAPGNGRAVWHDSSWHRRRRRPPISSGFPASWVDRNLQWQISLERVNRQPNGRDQQHNAH